MNKYMYILYVRWKTNSIRFHILLKHVLVKIVAIEKQEFYSEETPITDFPRSLRDESLYVTRSQDGTCVAIAHKAPRCTPRALKVELAGAMCTAWKSSSWI